MNTSLKTVFRHLWRYRLFSILNIFGLVISISAVWIIYRIVSYEFSYDHSLPNKENTYKVITAFDAADRKNSKMGGVAAPAPVHSFLTFSSPFLYLLQNLYTSWQRVH